MPAVLALPIALALEALAGALLLAAAISLAVFTRDLFRRLPWPIYLVAEATYAAVVGSIRAVVIWSVSGAENAAQALRALLVNPYLVMTHAVQAQLAFVQALQHLVQVTIPYTAAAYAQTVWGALQQEIADRNAAVSDLFWTAYNWVSGLFQWAQAGIAGAELHAAQGTAAAIAHADQLTAGAMARADREVAGEAAARAAGDRQGIAYTQAVGTEALGYAYRLGQALAADLGLAERQLEGYADQVGAAAAGYAATLTAGAIARADARAAAIEAEVTAIEDSPCQRFCNPLGDLGQALQELQDLGLVAAILALAAESARDAAGVGRGLASGLGPVARDLEASTRSLVGS